MPDAGSRDSARDRRGTQDERIRQAKVLWDKGWGRKLGFDSFEEYLATVPEIPGELKASDDRFPLLVLVDARLELVKICNLLGVNSFGNDQTFEDFDPNKAKTEKVYWIRCQDGQKNNGKSVSACRQQFVDAGDEVGLTVQEGLALFTQNPKELKDRVMDLPGSVRREDRDDTAYLNWYNGRLKLDWDWRGYESPDYGSGSRRA